MPRLTKPQNAAVWAGVLLIAICLPANADVVWPALLLEGHLLAWWTILLGLVIEFFVVRWLFKLPTSKAAVATLAANAASTILGLPLIPIAGVGLVFFPGYFVMKIFNWGTFNPVTWFLTYFVATLINTLIESQVYKRGFKLTIGKREFWWIFAANAVSVGLALSDAFLEPLH